jgi:hypothetical protein
VSNRTCPPPTPEDLAHRKDESAWWSNFFHELIFGDWLTGKTGKKQCFLVFLEATGEGMNPLDFHVDNPADVSDLVFKSTSELFNGFAFFQAATAMNIYGFPGLVTPLHSSIVRSHLETSEMLEGAAIFAAFDLSALAYGLPAEAHSVYEGNCDPTF